MVPQGHLPDEEAEVDFADVRVRVAGEAVKLRTKVTRKRGQPCGSVLTAGRLLVFVRRCAGGVERSAARRR